MIHVWEADSDGPLQKGKHVERQKTDWWAVFCPECQTESVTKCLWETWKSCNDVNCYCQWLLCLSAVAFDKWLYFPLMTLVLVDILEGCGNGRSYIGSAASAARCWGTSAVLASAFQQSAAPHVGSLCGFFNQSCQTNERRRCERHSGALTCLWEICCAQVPFTALLSLVKRETHYTARVSSSSWRPATILTCGLSRCDHGAGRFPPTTRVGRHD